MIYERNLSVVVVDGEPDIVELVVDILSAANCNVRIAVNGNDALRQAATNDLDLVFLDINIPEHEGWLVCSKLKLSGDSPTIVLITGRTECDRDRFDAFANADRVLRKPFFEKDLLRIVSQVNSAVPSDETRC